MPSAKYADTFMQTRAGGQRRRRQGGHGAAASSPASRASIEVEKRLIELVGADDRRGLVQRDRLSDYLRAAHADKKLSIGKQRVGVIVAAARFSMASSRRAPSAATRLARLMRQARLDKDIKAVVLRVDSPGGSVLASEQIYRELVALKAGGKPVVVSMSAYAASGGYYIAAPADEIWASPATITGSIGIFAIIPTFDKTLGKIGVSVDGVGTTPLSGQSRLDRPLTEGTKAVIQSVTTARLRRVPGARLRRRGKSIDEIEPDRAGTRVGRDRCQAPRPGRPARLVRRCGEVGRAPRQADRLQVKFIEPKLTWAQTLALNLKTKLIRTFFQATPDQVALAHLAQRLDPVTRQAELLSRFSQPNHLYAYCFCEVR